jgi:predicted ribosomally synthesized peptide with nif11-like leader
MAHATAALADFLSLARSNAELQLALMGIGSADEACAVAQGHGFEIAPADFAAWRDARLSELQDEELQPGDLADVVGGVALNPSTLNPTLTRSAKFLPADMLYFLRMIRA